MAYTDDYAIIGGTGDDFDCEAITGWTSSAGLTEDVSSVQSIQGTNSISLQGTATGLQTIYHDITVAGDRFKITSEDLHFWFFYAKGKGAAFLTGVSTALVIRLYFGGTVNYADYRVTESGDLSLVFGWQVLSCSGTELRGGVPNFALINAGSFVTGRQYIITTVGTTDFTAIGAESNTVGVRFTATGAGTGTGQASDTTNAIWDNDIHRVELRLDVSATNANGLAYMDAWFSGTKIVCSNGTVAVPDDADDIINYSNTRTAFPLGLVARTGNSIDLRCGLDVGNGSDGTNNEGNLVLSEDYIYFNQLSEEVKHNLVIENFSSLIIGEKEVGTDDNYAVRGCQVVLPPTRYSDVEVKAGGILRAFDSKFFRWRNLFFGQDTETTAATVELRAVQIDSCETAYFKATNLDLENVEIYNNSANDRDQAAEMLREPDSCINLLVHDCAHGIYFRETLTIDEYFAQDNTTRDLGILEGKTVSIVNGFFDPTKMIRLTA